MRLTSLDVVRGIAITSMILVNNPGSWSHVYPPLLHAEWHGCTPTDLVFPFFLFIAGTAMAFSLGKSVQENRAKTRTVPINLYWRIFRRCALLFFWGLLLNGYPNYDFTTIRIMGVLQRISIAYFLAAMIVLHLPRRGIWITLTILLLGYWGAMEWIPVPGYGPGQLTPEGNLGGYLDTLILSRDHLWKGGPYDPEGLFSTLPAVGTVLLGYLTGAWLKQQETTTQTSLNLAISGLCAVIIGSLWGAIFPLNKALWTSSYGVYTAGCALLLLAVCYETIEVRGWKAWGFPFKIMGSNSIFLFIASGFVARVLIFTHVSSDPKSASVKTWIYENWFAAWAGEMNGSLLFAVVTILLWLVVAYGLYRQSWFFKV
ncbi:MAG: acyltransferase family protein [Microcoleaceae cyanobacterium]